MQIKLKPDVETFRYDNSYDFEGVAIGSAISDVFTILQGQHIKVYPTTSIQ
jgi:hypothetical protein